MTKRMLIDATHAEETRVVVLDGSRLEDFDVETSTKKQLKGNIYLAKVVRVEPSLQAAFVEYGGNRHGFLAFGEIHPDYYQIPVADRQRLIELQAEEAREAEEEEDRAALASSDHGGADTRQPRETDIDEPPSDSGWPEPAANDSATVQALAIERETVHGDADHETHGAPTVDAHFVEAQFVAEAPEPSADAVAAAVAGDVSVTDEADTADDAAAEPHHAFKPEPVADAEPVHGAAADAVAAAIAGDVSVTAEADTAGEDALEPVDYSDAVETMAEAAPPETVGGEQDNGEDARERRIPSRFLRNYKIQEVIRRRQILLVQVVKEERGTKGAALTTYLSLAGRFSVLMPNSPRGGGISRKITSATDRRRLKEIMAELEIPQGMGMIVRTAGANRPKPEIKRDCEYLLRLWDDIREHTLKSVACALIYEEASLIKRAIRDVYSRDIDEILVDGEDGWRAAHDFMRMLMPSHAKKVQLWRDAGAAAAQPLFAKYAVEAQLDAMLQPNAQLRSGGYLVINQAEALVAIDVNSGRSTRERGIEETALRTNLEAADEVARQLRLRDLAGLIVIDFIDMEQRKHNAMVERRLKEALKNDRARIQIGSISHFGLMEMSRQRLRPSLAETSFIACPHCGGTGHVRSTESAAIHVLRGIEEEGAKRRAAEIVVYVATQVALYILNHKRERLHEIELRYAMHVNFAGDDAQITPQFRIDRVRPQIVSELPAAITQATAAAFQPELDVAEEEPEAPAVEDEADEEVGETAENGESEHVDGADVPVAGETSEEAEHRRRPRRRRRRGGRRDEAAPDAGADVAAAPAEAATARAEAPDEAGPAPASAEGAAEPVETAVGDDDQRGRRRGRRGGRRRRPEGAEGEMPPHAAPGADQPELPPVYLGPTPANPFGGHAFDIFDVMEQVEQNTTAAAPVFDATGEMPPVPPAAPEPVSPPMPPVPADEPAASSVAPVLAAELPPSQPNPEPAELPAMSQVPQAELSLEVRSSPEAEPAPEAEPTLVHAAAALPEPQPEPSPAEPELAMAANDVVPESAVKPIVIGVDEVPAVEKKRGWWRR